MQLWRTSLLASLAAFTLAVLSVSDGLGQDKKKDGKTKSVNFKTFDGVNIQGTLYPNPAGKKDAVVLLLHDFDAKKGGNSTQDGWPELAQALQANGYSVLAFDFRGFGESKEVNPETFWKVAPNYQLIRGANKAKPPESIEHKNFSSSYYAYLVNDVAAAKAYLDRRNDAKELNSGNVILIGAGQGATVGAMWAANECRRRRDRNPNPGFGVPMLGDPEVKDIAGCVWLTISPRLESRNVGAYLQRWLVEVGRTHKVPMGFYFGKSDRDGSDYASRLVNYVRGNSKDLPVATRGIDGSALVGSKLLDGPTIKQIIKDLGAVIEARGSREVIERKVTESAFYYVAPGTKRMTLNKKPGEDAPAVSLSQVGLQ